MKYVESSSGSSHSVQYGYDDINNLTSLVETINGTAHTTSYAYDDDNRLTTVTNGSVSKTYGYDAYSRVSGRTTKYGTSTILTDTLTYMIPMSNQGTTGQVGSLRSQAAGYDVTYTYNYDGNGNILYISDGTNTTLYAYDSANQLIRENNQAANKTWVWTYDDGGNITSRTEYPYSTGGLGTATSTVNYTYDTSWGDLLTGYNGQTISSDTIGNMLSDGTWTYTWEHGRELATMSNGTTTWTYTYNADGMRTSRSNGTTAYNYVYNGSSLSQMTVGSDTLYFAYDASTPMSVTYNGSTYYYVTNLQGDVTAILNTAGAPVVTYTYDAWGNILSANGTMADSLGTLNPLRYRSYVYDIETGLYYLQSRYYDPELGRFINADIYAATGQGLLGNNMFAYCGNNPANRSDLSGEAWWHWAAAAAVVAVAAVAVVATAGGAAGAIVAITAVANGVAVSSTATTVAAGVFIGSSTALAISAYGAYVEADSADEFADYGASALVSTVVGGGIGGVAAYNLPGHNCFIAGTLVQTDDGTIPIEDLRPGDYVLAWDEETETVGPKPVVETYVNETNELIHVYVNGEEIITTPTHPFYSPVKGWTDAVRLRAGDILVLVNGEYVVVEKIQHEILERPITVYNFQVEDYHTYFITEIGILVHNRCTNPNGKKGGPAHQEKIHEIGTDLEDRGYSVTYEARINTAGGNKDTRYADIYATNGSDAFAVQVGRMTRGGIPVIRERRALSDIISAGFNAIFLPY